MRSGDEWRHEEPEFDQETHGEFGGRLSRGVDSCREEVSYSMWHMMAAKLLGPKAQAEFLEAASNGDVSSNQLIDDLREGMGMFQVHHRSNLHEGSWEDLVRRTAFKTPLEICAELNVPLILWDEEDEFRGQLHPVIIAAQRESLRLIGWPQDEVL